MDEVIGIDLGTTYSAVAHITADGKAEVIPDEEGRATTPSVIYLGESTPLVGYEAKTHQGEGSTEIASFFKRNMGDPNFVLTFRGQRYTPIDLSALVLATMKAQAERFLGKPVRDAVITVPAYFTHVERQATIDAGQKAGINVLSIISEPTAAALAYGLRPSVQRQQVVVYDLGGGTFDVSLVEITADALTVKGTDGDHRLGGKDWDDRLIRYLQDRFQTEFGVDLVGDDINQLLVQTETLKRSLSARMSADIRLQAQGQTVTYTVTREQFDSLCQDLLERTGQLVINVLQEAGLTWDQIDGIVPVGGSTRMPMVRAYIEQLSGKTLMGGINPDEAVALGAAIQAQMEMERRSGSPTRAIGGRRQVQDVIAHSLGLIAESEDRSRYLNSILIPRNLPIPSTRARPFKMRLRRSGDTTLEVFLTQGETDNPQHSAYLGRYIFTNFPSVRDGTAVLDITYAYDQNGVVTISAVERSTGQPLTLTIEPVPPDVPSRFLESPKITRERDHITLYMVFDVSGSMSGRPLDDAKRAAEKLVSECDLSTTSIGLMAVSDSTHVDQAATQNANEITRAIRHMHAGSTGGGNSGHPFDEIYNRLQQLQGLRIAIVLADGVWSNQSLAIKRAKRCHEAGIQIIAIGFGGADEAFLRAIASSTDLSLLTSQDKLSDAFSTIAREITEGAGDAGSGRGIRLSR